MSEPDQEPFSGSEDGADDRDPDTNAEIAQADAPRTRAIDDMVDDEEDDYEED
ncbi:MAG: hypothetical protein HOV71_19215 [Hamadaea sp.]|uniref:hypothetical protein n=1 Tax=Hamadaea sp. NPDC050747 TaxID=3155789 RepID=UPI0017B49567|nr:hypothetical protein [Hamadaea sp.]NUR50262.1 hypothetical protein [Hamadaea sp.]NUT06386.1 hypothetical protein [Hamadaea sp.]